MTRLNKKSSYNLKAVVQETGLKPDTLRAWERRYGLPHPERTGGGHRLYSQRDIEVLKWLVARQQEGLSISRAVELWRQLETDGQNPLRVAPIPQASGAFLPLFSAGPGQGTLAEMREGWITACLSFDEVQAEQILTQAFALYPAEMVCLELLQRGIAQIGEGWYQNRVSVPQEHFASVLAMRRLEALVTATPPPHRAGRLLVGCPATEDHTFGPLLLTFLLRRRGWAVIYLGANVPSLHLSKTVQIIRPKLVILPAQRLVTAASLIEMGNLLREEQAPMAFGGLIFNSLPALRNKIPGYFLGEQLVDAPETVERLLRAPALPAPAATPSQAYLQALKLYRERQAAIEVDVWQALKGTEISPGQLDEANNHMADNIKAALTLGDINFLGNSISWVEGLLVNYQTPVKQLEVYLEAYYEAVRTHLDRTHPVTLWLKQLSSNKR
jgi:DNA-binding transcriptional MerR regulator